MGAQGRDFHGFQCGLGFRFLGFKVQSLGFQMISLFKVFLSKGEAVGRDSSYSQVIPYLVIIILEQKCFIIYLDIVGSRTSTTQEGFYEWLTGLQ